MILLREKNNLKNEVDTSIQTHIRILSDQKTFGTLKYKKISKVHYNLGAINRVSITSYIKSSKKMFVFCNKNKSVSICRQEWVTLNRSLII